MIQRRFLLPLIAVLLSATVQAQDTAYMHEVLTTLCSERLGGRGYVDDGDNEAAFYIEEQFKELDLQAWDYNHYQTFFIAVNSFPGKMELRLDGTELVPGTDYIIAPDAPSVKGDWAVTYLEKLPAIAPSGRMMDSTLVLSGAVVLPDSLVRSLPRPIRGELLKGLKRAGAQLFIRSSDTKLTWHVSANQGDLPEFTVRDSFLSTRPQRISVNTEAKLLKKHRTQNVLAYTPGTSGCDSTIVFTAHYDHLGKMGCNTIFPGANDNASGVTMLLSLAKHFSMPENAPLHNIAFIAFAGEEIGLLGSTHYVEHPVFPLTDIVFLVNLDIVGTGDDGVKVVNGAVHRKQFDKLVYLNGVGKYLPKVESRGRAANSDHHPFTEMGVPAFYIYTLGGSASYHDPNDRPEGLSLAGFQGLFRLLVEFTSFF
ncbi:MAG: M28 family peptidase [Flavobacteriales bacterium]|nr:M28 family peptidase [Flavobacteriales bacterium]